MHSSTANPQVHCIFVISTLVIALASNSLGLFFLHDVFVLFQLDRLFAKEGVNAVFRVLAVSSLVIIMNFSNEMFLLMHDLAVTGILLICHRHYQEKKKAAEEAKKKAAEEAKKKAAEEAKKKAAEEAKKKAAEEAKKKAASAEEAKKKAAEEAKKKAAEEAKKKPSFSTCVKAFAHEDKDLLTNIAWGFWPTSTYFRASKFLKPSKLSCQNVQFKAINDSSVDVRVDWVDFDGKLKTYHNCPAGQVYFMPRTYEGHNWLFTVTSKGSKHGLKAGFEMKGDKCQLRIFEDSCGSVMLEGPEYNMW